MKPLLVYLRLEALRIRSCLLDVMFWSVMSSIACAEPWAPRSLLDIIVSTACRLRNELLAKQQCGGEKRYQQYGEEDPLKGVGGLGPTKSDDVHAAGFFILRV